jgi:adenylate kinase family enzyme
MDLDLWEPDKGYQRVHSFSPPIMASGKPLLIFVYGKPAAGKLTVSKELAAQTGYRLFDNHKVVDAAKAIYTIFSPGFIKLRDAFWRAAFAQVAAEWEEDSKADEDAKKGLIFTFNPESSVPQEFIDWVFELFKDRMLSVELTADEEALENRMGNASRSNKLQDANVYRQLRDAGIDDSPKIPRTDLQINTGNSSPADTATLIAKRMSEKQ